MTSEEKKAVLDIFTNYVIVDVNGTHEFCPRDMALEIALKGLGKEEGYVDIGGYEYTWENPVIWADEATNKMLNEVNRTTDHSYFQTDKTKRIYHRNKLTTDEQGRPCLDTNRETLTLKEVKTQLANHISQLRTFGERSK